MTRGEKLLSSLGDQLAGLRGRITPNAEMDKVTWFRAGYIGTMVFTVLFVAWLGEYATDENEHELESLSGIDPLTACLRSRSATRLPPANRPFCA